MSMFCRQCEQTAKGESCNVSGVCGKDPRVAALQDLLIYNLKGLAWLGNKLRTLGKKDSEADLAIMEGLFATVTNVSFDSERLVETIYKTSDIKNKLKEALHSEWKDKCDCDNDLPQAATFKPAESLEGLIAQGEDLGLLSKDSGDEDVRSLKELLLYGFKGMASYADHAAILGETDDEVISFFYKGLSALLDSSLGLNDFLSLNMELGKANLKCMEILDKAHTTNYGHPQPTPVPLTIKKGPAIIISGHDLHDLKLLLEQTEGKGVNIYTHGEMLPAHGYPELHKHKHLAGHFGGAWQEQQKEFDSVPAAILFTTNCIQKPRDSYKDRVFTTGLVSWPEIKDVKGVSGKKDFSPVIEKALELGGFTEEKQDKEILVGFGHNAVLGSAGKIVEAVKSGALKHFFLIGGCDGAKPGRNYYTDFAQQVPKDCIILTLACGKFRFNKLDFGMLGDFPRLLDVGQCNDAYSAIKIALALADAFDCSVNDLPLSMIISWYEQKAVVILLTLLSLGVKKIRLGPTLPAFVSPNVLKVLVEKFEIAPITTPEQDLAAILGESVKS
jgi:hydroxylamine reductase